MIMIPILLLVFMFTGILGFALTFSGLITKKKNVSKILSLMIYGVWTLLNTLGLLIYGYIMLR